MFIPLREQSSGTHASEVLADSWRVRTCVPISGAYIKEPFITRYARAGAAKKAAGCGEGARGASLSYLEPFPVNLGPALSLVVVLRTLVSTPSQPSQSNALTHTRARACDGVGQRFRRVCVRYCIWLQARL